MKKKEAWIGALCVIAASMIWGATGLVVRKLNEAGFSNIDVLETRALLGALFTGIYLFIKSPKDFRFRLKDVWCFIGTGILNLMLCGVCNFYCIQNTSLAIADAMIQTGPMFALIFGCLLFKEKFTLQKCVAMALTFSGCVLASGLSGSERLTTVGFLLGLGAGVGYSMYSVFGRFAMNRGYNPIAITFYSFVFCAIGCAFFANWGGMAHAVTTVPSTWLWVVAVGLANGFGAYVLYTNGLSRLETGKASILCSLELVTSALIGVLIYGEHLRPAVGVGLVMIILGIAVLGLSSKKELEKG